jgi:hypothetical protein
MQKLLQKLLSSPDSQKLSWASSCYMKVSLEDPDSLISLSPAEGSNVGSTGTTRFN